MGRGGRDVPAAGELELGVGARDLEEPAVVAVVVPEAAGHAQSDPVAVPGGQLVEAVGVPRDAEPHQCDVDGALAGTVTTLPDAVTRSRGTPPRTEATRVP